MIDDGVKTSAPAAPQKGAAGWRPFAPRLWRFAAFVVALAAAFAAPLGDLLRFSMKSDFFSYIPLVPFITIYLVGLSRSKLPVDSPRSWPWAALFTTAGLALLGLYFGALRLESWFDNSEYLALMTLSFLLFLAGGSFVFLGAAWMRQIIFPTAFLLFCIPIPKIALDSIEQFFQMTSAWMADAFLRLAHTPHVSHGLIVELSDITLRVAPECSGIHSTMVLLMTSLLAGHMFLRSKWRRLFLVLFVVPLAIARNGFRIFTIGELCVHIGPDMIESPIHHRGGPIFFALSLIPFFALLYYLKKTEPLPPRVPAPAASISPNPL